MRGRMLYSIYNRVPSAGRHVLLGRCVDNRSTSKRPKMAGTLLLLCIAALAAVSPSTRKCLNDFTISVARIYS